MIGECLILSFQCSIRSQYVHFLSVRCEVEEADTLEQASPVPDVVVERSEEFYDQSYVNDKENAASEVSLNQGQV